MEIRTESAVYNLNKKTPYAKWLMGWKAGNGFTGGSTLDCAWTEAQNVKIPGCSWYALGYLMATQQQRGRELEAREWKEILTV